MAGLTEEQFNALVVIERTCSTISLVACAFTILTFCCSKYFSKSINRLIFYASFGNILTNTGTMMARSFIDEPDSAGCQAQAFLIQTFLPADVLWTLCMAINVYLTFYHKFEARDLRRIEPIYLLLCYGIPFIPGFTFLFVKDRGGDRIYGPAVSWCWISREWDVLRVAAFYAPMWFCILFIFAIYIRAGRTIFKVRKQVYIFQSSDLDPISIDEVTSFPSTDPTLTMEAIHDPDPTKLEHNLGLQQPNSYAAGSSSDTATRPHSVHLATNKSTQSNQSDGPHATYYDYATPPHRGSNPPQPRQPSHSATSRALRLIRRRNHERDNAAWSYTKCALLFFTAMLITWIPSSANRLYSLTHHNSVSVPLEFMSVFVLPLQGFWNCLVYVVTSWTATKNLFHDMWLAVRAFAIDRMERIRGRTHNEETPES
ncbi:G_PROTEIN_RECEP_F2_4 domain-containing protein [Trichoderma simmonsii]|uniref:G_PROTEIN_RECEP_F2_4 domain-containing protein n=1 Tax=Trichoderma simmonsii TaxID=1491479 RepID=A0A8G0L8M4_9HYPO|nr:G_PROTEIN_RECEP_F2_4 domain-containing protein [Trichoderma simmonsii]